MRSNFSYIFSLKYNYQRHFSRHSHKHFLKMSFTTIPHANKSLQETRESFYGLISNQTDLNTWATTRKHDKTVTSIAPMNEFLKRIDCDISALNVVHVAGTKGKGSTCAMVERLLREQGLRTGLFTSPHLITETERFRIEGKAVSNQLFIDHYWHVYTKLKESNKDSEFGMPTWFRMVTLLGLHIFVHERVDVAVVEVGVGGRADATNCVSPVVCGVTALGLDHTDVLGDTIAEIAAEKAGIFKTGVPALSYTQPADAAVVLRERAERVGAPYRLVDTHDALARLPPHLGIGGAHQRHNAALALALAATFLERTGRAPLTDAAQQQALRRCQWPGRAHVVADPLAPRLRLHIDGAHTADSMRAATRWFAATRRRSSTLVLLFACCKTRDPAPLFENLLENIETNANETDDTFASVFFSTFRTDSLNGATRERGEHAWRTSEERAAAHGLPSLTWQQQMASMFQSAAGERHRGAVHCVASAGDALQCCRALAQRHPHQDIDVFVTGSLYLAGAVLESVNFDTTATL